jgi:hypothetical protein
MALIYSGMPCAICGEPLDIHGPRVATTHFIGDETDPLWRFSDTAMHYSCFQEWKHREEFVKKYNDSVKERNEIVARYNELVARMEKGQGGSGAKP